MMQLTHLKGTWQVADPYQKFHLPIRIEKEDSPFSSRYVKIFKIFYGLNYLPHRLNIAED